ncbi:hypothetical protein EJ110_NYTH51365 [Nymphaea thermarum]|nr:hypothetical protein EJ110_NYTH51365 [Nymphaea thermarum]
MKPSFLPKELLKDAPSEGNLTAMPKLSLGANGTCPEGTVPILRGPQDPNIVTKSRRSLPSLQYSTAGHEYAVLSTSGSKYHGSSAVLNLWNPLVDAKDAGFSLGQLWAVSGSGDAVNTVEAGWHVYPNFYSGDTRTRLFIYWTSDGYKKTGCYNLNCPGFVQVSRKLAPGVVLPASTYKGSQLYMKFFVYRDPKTAHWWLRIGEEWVGYWPRTIFTTLASGATFLEWGGEIINGGTTVHTTTDMGSGHFPSKGSDGVSASFNSLLYVDQNYKVMKPTSVSAIVSRPKCYGLKVFGDVGGNRGYTFFRRSCSDRPLK